MNPQYTEHPELLPKYATCQTCAKGCNGRGTCPVFGKTSKCSAWVLLTDTDKPERPLQTKVEAKLEEVPRELVPALVTEDVARLAERVLKVWRIQLGNGDFNKYAIINYRHPVLGPVYERFQAKAAELLRGRTLHEDTAYVLWSLTMFGGGVRKEFARYCERVELQNEIDKRKEGQAS